MTIFVTGGCKNGKSTFALRQALGLAGIGPRYYIATLDPQDSDERACVLAHQEAREGMGFITFELPTALPPCPAGADTTGVFLLDSVTALLYNEMFSNGKTMDVTATERIRRDLDRFLSTVEHAVIVSDYIYADNMAYSPSTKAFMHGLAELDSFLARRCSCVVEICAGIPTVHKGALMIEEKSPCI